MSLINNKAGTNGRDTVRVMNLVTSWEESSLVREWCY